MRARRPGGDGLKREVSIPTEGSGEPRGGGADRIPIGSAPPFLCGGVKSAAGSQEPDVDPLLEPGGPPPPGAPEWLPMFGQFLVEPDPEPAFEPEPELPVLELDDGVVADEPELPVLELVPELPELPVAVDVVAALATSAPPARRPDVNAPTARTLRRRICMADVPFRLCWSADPFGPVVRTLRPGSVRSRRVPWAGTWSYPTNR